MRGLPVGDQVFENIPFKVIDPTVNQRRSAIALSYDNGFPGSAEVLIKDSAPTVFLLHSSSDNIPSEFAGAITFLYSDGTERSRNIVKFKDVTNWWFSSLNSVNAGVAWSGPNPVSTKVGVCWAAIANPEPEKMIEKLIFRAPIEGGIYAILGITLADKPFYIKPSTESFGGPDNWAAANAMAALVEGLAGVKNKGLAFSKAELSPRWCTAGTDSVNVTICFPSSGGYLSYCYKNNRDRGEIYILVTGSGDELSGHVLLPRETKSVKSVTIGGATVSFTVSKVEKSQYADFKASLGKVQRIMISYLR